MKEFHAELPEYIELRLVNEPVLRLPGTESLGRGEAEALLLARELKARLLLTDDRKARLAAHRLNIPCVGLVGLVVRGKRLGLIPSIGEFLLLLEKKGGLYLSDSVVSEALRLADES